MNPFFFILFEHPFDVSVPISWVLGLDSRWRGFEELLREVSEDRGVANFHPDQPIIRLKAHIVVEKEKATP